MTLASDSDVALAKRTASLWPVICVWSLAVRKTGYLVTSIERPTYLATFINVSAHNRKLVIIKFQSGITS